MYADRRCSLKVPLAGVMLFERLVCEYSRGAYFDKISAELALKRAIFMPAEIHVVVRCKDVKVSAPCIVTVESDTAVAGDAAIHLMVNEGAEVLIPVGTFFKTCPAVIVPGHDCYILEMALTAFIADRTIMGMAHHEPFDDARAEGSRIRIID